MNQPRQEQAVIYEIRLESQLTPGWSAWFEGLEIRNEADGQTILSGAIIDQAALFGVLARISNLFSGKGGLPRWRQNQNNKSER